MQKFLKLLTAFLIIASRWKVTVQSAGKIQDQIKANEEDIRKLEMEIDLETKWLGFDEAIASVKHQIATSEDELRKCREQNKSQLNSILIGVQEIQSNIREYESRLQQKEDTIKAQTLEIEEKSREIKEAYQQIDDYREQINMKDLGIKNLQSTIESYKIIIDKNNVAISTLESGSKQINQETTRMQRTNEIDELNNLLINCNNNIGFLNNQLGALERNLSDLNIELTSCNTLKSELQKELRDKNGELSECILKNEQTTLPTTPATRLPKSCLCTSSDTREIQLSNEARIQVRCDRDGWLIIQQRMDGKQDFNKNWEEYKAGFGDIRADFFIGLENLHLLTSSTQHELHISMMYNKHRFEIKYDNFRIGNSTSRYELVSIGVATGNAANGLWYDLKMKFTTYDRNHNAKANQKCAANNMGGWWQLCSFSNLNAPYIDKLRWANYPVSSVIMKIRPKSTSLF